MNQRQREETWEDLMDALQDAEVAWRGQFNKHLLHQSEIDQINSKFVFVGKLLNRRTSRTGLVSCTEHLDILFRMIQFVNIKMTHS